MALDETQMDEGEFVVFGFVREQSDKMEVPNAIIAIIVTYYQMVISWYKEKYGKFIQFNDNKLIKMTDSADRYSTCLTNKMITKKMCNKFDIKFRIYGDSGNYVNCLIGYVQSFDSWINWNQGIGRRDNKFTTCSFYIDSSNDKLYVYDISIGSGKTELSYTSDTNFKSKDTFTLSFDFDNNTLQIYHNENAADKISLCQIKSVIPGVSLTNKDSTVQILSCKLYN